MRNQYLKTKQTNSKGITLVALIISIIVLLVLATVSISIVINNGILDKAKSAVDKYSEGEIEEQIKSAYSEWEVAKWTENAGDAATFMRTRLRTALNDNGLTVTGENGAFTVTLTGGKKYLFSSSTGKTEKVKTVAEYPEIAPNTIATENSRYISDGKTAVIPAGYSISNVSTEQSIDNGLVIKKDGNEWVWIPVDNVTDLYDENNTNINWIMCGTSENNEVKTQYKSKSAILLGITRTTPGDTLGFREPDIVVGDGTQFDADDNNRITAGFVELNGTSSSLETMAKSLRNDYKNMIDSVRKYGGFYIGRYELSNEGTKKNQISLTNTNWYNLYAKCKAIDNTSVETRMIWGCNWDKVCEFINTSGDKVSLTDSSTYGNFKNSQYPANTGNYVQNTKKNTGSNEAWKTNNIYDIAGNCQEWTQEIFGTECHIFRGGGYNIRSSSVSGHTNNNYNPNSQLSVVSSRPVLYLK